MKEADGIRVPLLPCISKERYFMTLWFSGRQLLELPCHDDMRHLRLLDKAEACTLSRLLAFQVQVFLSINKLQTDKPCSGSAA